MKQWDPRTTYRVRQLPCHLVDRSDAVALLVRLQESLGPAENILMFPLASSANIWEREPSKTATMMFKRLPEFLDDERDEWVLRASDMGYRDNIIIDTHFLDFTVFNNVTSDSHDLDCIAISGLSSHAFGSWRSQGHDPNFMWLRDKLPRDLPSIRSITYGYDTRLLLSKSIQTVDDIARMFLNKLETIGRASLSSKPIIFLAHSLGGIILKRALVMLAGSGDKERFILSSVKAVVLFGVPSKGMHTNHLLPMVQGQPNERLVKLLSPDSPYLETLEEQFDGIAGLRHIRLVSLYETGLSKTAKKSKNGAWARNGPEKMLVDPESAISARSKDNDRVPIDRDHSNLAKFAEDDHNYRAVLSRLYNIRQSLIQPSQNSIEHDGFSQAQMERLTNKPDSANPQIKMMQSLKVIESTSRLKDIKKAYEETFVWIYEPKVGFSDWLQDNSRNIFWIQGKPGSGKSTLMKYIWNNSRTTEILSQSSHHGNLVPISFFFHNRGSHLQKSLEGLYRDIIHQILKKVPELQILVLRIFQQLKKSNHSRLGMNEISTVASEASLATDEVSWTLSDLEDAFQAILEQYSSRITLMLFLDALDEYDGPPERIAEFVKRVVKVNPSAATNLKICFSSRPWPHFVDQFGSFAGLEIHIHTVEDIRRYVVGRLRSDPVASRAISSSQTSSPPEDSELIADILKNAQGVFLWVSLIMDEIIRASAYGEDLGGVVSSFPQELEEIYRWTIERIPEEERVRRESYVMFEIVLRSAAPLSLDAYADAVACAGCKTFQESYANSYGRPKASDFLEKFLRRLKHRCGGLIEVRQADYGQYVQFMHQTVKDFVAHPGFQQQILGPESPPWAENGFSFLAKYFLTLLLTASKNDYSSETSVFEMNYLRLFRLAFKSESTIGKSHRIFFDSIDDKDLQKLYSRVNPANTFLFVDNSHVEDVGITTPINSVLSFAVFANLKLFVTETLIEGSPVNKNPELSLLHCAIEAAIKAAAMDEVADWAGLPSDEMASDMTEMTRILLTLEANKEQRYRNRTPFQFLVIRLAFMAHPLKVKTMMLKMVELFLKHGQDPNTDIETNTLKGPGPLFCKPIHGADARFIKVLLQHGANVNALDSDGHTALDWSYSLSTKLYDFYGIDHDKGLKYLLNTILERTMLLLKHGGCVTRMPSTVSEHEGTKYAQFVDLLEALSPETNSCIRSPPILGTVQREEEDNLPTRYKRPRTRLQPKKHQ